MIIFNLLKIAATALLMRIKGGGLGPSPVSGRIISAGAFGLMCMVALDHMRGLLGGVGWWLGNKMSMGEIAGAIGGLRGNWRHEGAEWGWKQGLQRGIFTGALISVALWNPAFVVAGASFPLAYWMGITIEQLRTRTIAVNWYLGEIIFGAFLGGALCL